jgi:hypothetical protein
MRQLCLKGQPLKSCDLWVLVCLCNGDSITVYEIRWCIEAIIIVWYQVLISGCKKVVLETPEQYYKIAFICVYTYHYLQI